MHTKQPSFEYVVPSSLFWFVKRMLSQICGGDVVSLEGILSVWKYGEHQKRMNPFERISWSTVWNRCRDESIIYTYFVVDTGHVSTQSVCRPHITRWRHVSVPGTQSCMHEVAYWFRLMNEHGMSPSIMTHWLRFQYCIRTSSAKSLSETDGPLLNRPQWYECRPIMRRQR